MYRSIQGLTEVLKYIISSTDPSARNGSVSETKIIIRWLWR